VATAGASLSVPLPPGAVLPEASADASTEVRRLASALLTLARLAEGTSADNLWARASASRSNEVANSTLAEVAVRFISSARAIAAPACAGLL